MLWGFRKQDILADAFIISVALFTTFILRYTPLVEDLFLSLFLKFMIYLVDLSVFVATFIGLSAKGPLLVFYLFRVVGLVFSQTFALNDTVLFPILAYLTFRLGCAAVNCHLGLHTIAPSETKIDDQLKQKEEKRKLYCVSLFFVCGLMVLGFNTDYPLLPLFTLVLSLFSGGCELLRLAKAEEYQSRLIGNTFHFNLYLLVTLNLGLGKAYHQEWLYYADPTVAYFLFTFLALRLIVASLSFKFHRDDQELFQAFYPFYYQDIHRKLRLNDSFNRVAKCMDKMSRKLGVVVYLLSVALTTQGRGYFWLLLSVLVLNNYKIQNSQDHPLGFIESRLRMKVRANITVPLLLLGWEVRKETQCQKDIIYGVVSGCQQHQINQFTFAILLLVVLCASQLIPDIKRRVKVEKAVAFACPLLVFMVIFGLECQSVQSALMVLYLLVLACVVIRDDRLSVSKGVKKA